MLKDDLYNIGVDVDGTVSDFFGDDYDIYYETLKALAADTKIDELKAAIKKKDVSGAFEAAHCLKAAVGMCGNEILMQRLVVLVEILRKNGYIVSTMNAKGYKNNSKLMIFMEIDDTELSDS